MVRPSVPLDVKRQLRQEAGFGCCNCGHPFIEYHHIVPYAEDPHMRPEDMMIVCGQCHTLLTAGAIPVEEQRAWKRRPRNVIENKVNGRLYVTTGDLRVHLAGGMAINTPRLIAIDGEEIVVIQRGEDGRVEVSAIVQDDQGDTIATIRSNEWEATPERVWDFEAHPRSALVRYGPGRISFDIARRIRRDVHRVA